MPPDLTVARLRNDPAACPQVLLVARVGNAGSLHVPAGVPVEFWQGDPEAGGTRIGVVATARALEPGEHEEVRLAWPAAPPGGAAVQAWVSPQRPWKTVRSNDLVGEINARAPLAYANGSSQTSHGWGIFTYFALEGSGWTDNGSFDLEWLPHRFYELGFAIPVGIESVTLTNGSFPAAGWRTVDFLLWREQDVVPSVAMPVSFDSSSVTINVPDTAGARRFRLQGNDVENHAAIQSLAVAGSFEDPYPDPAAGIYPRLNEGRDDNNRVAAFLAWTCAGNVAPAITSAPLLRARPGELYLYPLAAEDPNGDLVTFELLAGPNSLVLATPSGRSSGRRSRRKYGEHAVRVRAAGSVGRRGRAGVDDRRGERHRGREPRAADHLGGAIRGHRCGLDARLHGQRPRWRRAPVAAPLRPPGAGARRRERPAVLVPRGGRLRGGRARRGRPWGLR